MQDELTALARQAHAAAERGHLDEAISGLLAAASHTHAAEHEYLSVLRSLENAFVRRGDAREALTVIAYVAGKDASAWKRAEPILPLVTPADRAMVAAAQSRWDDAARELESAGRIVAAAIYRERAGEWAKARTLWSNLTRTTEKGEPYVAALAQFNLARCARRSANAVLARQAGVACVRLLEEAADDFESKGQRERAFDCFQVLVEVGRESQTFEDILEGSVNSIRILREDHLSHFALAHFEAAIRAAAEYQETNAAATFAGEAAAYARSLGMTAAGNAHTFRQGELWHATAKHHQSRNAPVEVVAHSLLAAILAFSSINQYAHVGDIYTELALLDLPSRRREHYAHAARRYIGAADEPLALAPLSAPNGPSEAAAGEIWHADLLEWEHQGAPEEACADVMLDTGWLDLIRRKAMLCRLTALRANAGSAGDITAARVLLCAQLGQIQNYAVMSPLEKLFGSPERAVKIAALSAVQTLFYKRSFVIVRAALGDRDDAVTSHAARAIEALRFPHAFDPLSRIYRESSFPSVRAAALTALIHIATPESADFFLGVLEHGPPSDRALALAAIQQSGGNRFLELARQAIERAPEPRRARLSELLIGGRKRRDH